MPDPRIALAAGNPSMPDIGQAVAGAAQLMQFKQAQEQAGRQNALRNILGSPGAIDATGQPTPETLTKVMGVDPNVGLQLQQNALVGQQKKLQLDALTTKTAFDTASNLNDAYSPILTQYKTNIEKGMPPDAAMREAQTATESTTERLRNGGGLTPNVAQSLPTKFDPAAFELKAMQSDRYMQWWKTQQEEKRQTNLDQRAGEQTWLDATGKPFILRPNMAPGKNATYLDGTPVPQDALSGAHKGGAVSAGKPEDVTVDGQHTQAIWQGNHWTDLQGNPIPTTSNVQRAAKAGAEGSTTANRAAIAADIAKDPAFKDASPGKIAAEAERQFRVAQGLINSPEQINTEAEQIASYDSAPLSGYALRSPEGIKIMARVKELDPNYSALEYNNYNKTVSGFGPGKQGDTIRYINNAIQHIDVMQKAADALGSGDNRTFNRLGNAIGKEFGVAAPTTFDGLRQIVGTEIERAATGGVGAAIDRDRIIEALNKANSPEQLKDVFTKFKALFGGQVASLKTQYESGTPDRPSFRGDGPFSFDRKLLPETRSELPAGNRAAGAATAGGARPAEQAAVAGSRATPEQMQTLPKPATPEAATALGAGKLFVTPGGLIGIVPGAPTATTVPKPSSTATFAPSPAGTAATPAAATSTASTPNQHVWSMPPTKELLVPGKVYQTRRGPATWDGAMFQSTQ